MSLKGAGLFRHSGTVKAVAHAHLHVMRRKYPVLLLSIGNIFGGFL